MSNTINLNIQPQASIYALFSRLSYQEWYALAEFVDNSTASYYLHKDELNKFGFEKLVVEINYDPTTETITIEDNAFGMELVDFKRAILLDAKPTVMGRNEFGYGLKTAATWFGRRWSVISSELGSNNCYSAHIDIDDLVSSKKNDTDIVVENEEPLKHYTKITITKLNRKLNTIKIKNKIVDILNRMYRRDLKNGNIEIIYNGTKLTFQDYDILNFRGVNWKKDIRFSFMYNEKEYMVSGFVGIMEKGGLDKAGFALFRNNRAIDYDFKPEEIFGSSKTTTQIALKLFGELDMDCFEVNQAKDGFSWNSELKELFILNLRNNICDYIEVAKMSKKDREIENEVKEKIIKNSKIDQSTTKPVEIPTEVSNLSDSTEFTETKDIIADDVKFNIKFNDNEYTVVWIDDLNNDFLYKFENFELKLNNNHNYIKKIVSNDCKKYISEVMLAFCLAEEKAKLSRNEDGYISPSVIHNKFDQILSDMK